MPYYIEKGCVGCHYCKSECPSEAIRYKGAGYQITADKCISCGRCAEVCHLGLIKNTDSPEPAAEPHDPIHLSCDVLVIGAGGVGTGAAARASSLGFDVILIEAAKQYGGGTYLAHGAVFPASKVVYGRLGIEYDLDESVSRWLFMSGGKLQDSEKLRKNLIANGEFLDWFDSLDPSYGTVFTKGSPGFPFKIDIPRRYLNTKAKDDSIGPGWMGSWITDKLFETALKNGIRYYNKTRALKFIIGCDGKITGIIAKDPGGIIQIDAKAFVLGTGGYLMNDERMKAIDPDFIRGDATMLRLNVPTNIGDGHDMVSEIGGQVDYSRGRVRGPVHHPYCYSVYRMMNSPRNVFFSDEGKRFFEMSNMLPGPGGQTGSEDQPDPGQLILHSRTGKCYVIMDSEQLELEGQGLLDHMMEGHDDYLKDWRQEIEEEVSLEDWPARKADSIAELAAKLGMDPERLTESIIRYNKLCEKGVDEDFGKKPEHMHPIQKPPYYAFMGQNFDNGASLGGIAIDDEFRVINRETEPFDGLYCAGDCATYDPAENKGPVGLCGGLGGSWASGFQIANYIEGYLKL